MAMVRIALFLALVALMAAPSLAQSPDEPSYVINLRDAEIAELAEQVSEITGRTLVLDPSVSGVTTVISGAPLGEDGVWRLFQSVLRGQGYAALRSGEIWRVVPQGVINQGAAAPAGAGAQDFVTRVVTLDALPSAAAAAALRPLVASFGYLQPIESPNALIMTDTAENVRRIAALAQSLDRGDQGELKVVDLAHADPQRTAEAITQVLTARPAEGPAPVVTFDARARALIIRAGPERLAEVMALVARLDRPVAEPAERLITIPLRFADAAQAAEALGTIMGTRAAEGETAAEGPRIAFDARSNALLVRAGPRAATQIEQLAASIDLEQATSVVVIPLRFADAGQVGAALERILDEPGDSVRAAPRLSVDEGGNTLLVRADPRALPRIRDLVAGLDVPPQADAAPVTAVVRLRHGDAEAIATVVRGVLGEPEPARNPVARALPTDQPPGSARLAGLQQAIDRGETEALTDPAPRTLSDAPPADAAVATGDVAIQPAPSLNAIVLRGPAAQVAQIEGLIRNLDQRRPQVLIEAAIVEITGDAAEQLGVQLGAAAAAVDTGAGVTSFSAAGVPLRAILAALGAPAAGLVGEGLSLGLNVADDFSILIQALSQSSNANLLSTPSLTTLDNEAAEIVVGQNVPFRTGSFTIDGNATDPFTTIEREDIGLTLRVEPRVHAGDVVRLSVAQEVSSLVNATLSGAADIVTNRRSIETTVLADDGETIVLGGLISDDRISTESKVPLLGDIPVAGRLFRAESESRSRRTLFVFLRPTILRDRDASARAARGKYERLRAVEFEPLTSGGGLFSPPAAPLPLEIEGIY